MKYIEFEKYLIEVEKPTRYTGEELNMIRKEKGSYDIRYCFCFPDIYEIGMSHLGLRIMYEVLNRIPNVYCERSFVPWVDCEKLMKEKEMPLYALESKDSLREFDFLGFTLQYEMSFTNILHMMALADIPYLKKDRDDNDPIICAGGPCAFNPEPLVDFVDFFVIGEAEEVTKEILALYKPNMKKSDFLEKIKSIEGIYVPSLYEVIYNDDNTILEITGDVVKKRIIKDLDSSIFPSKPIVPFNKIVHDRAVLEIFRGCIRGCRFCQAGFIYRPVREKSTDKLLSQANEMIEQSGYEELSLASLSTSDYSCLDKLTKGLMTLVDEKMINLALPSLRVDSVSLELLKKASNNRKSGLTFAPEAGTQRLRDVINKGITEESILSSCKLAFENGYRSIKLYFMLGLPTETDEDVEGIYRLTQEIINIYRENVSKKLQGLSIHVSTSFFVPKAHTPFQWVGQLDRETYLKRVAYLTSKLRQRCVKYNWHEEDTSYLEALIARGDRKVGTVIQKAYEKGCKLDGWRDFFLPEKWFEAIEEANIDADFYVTRQRELDEIFPWEKIDSLVSKRFLLKEWDRAKNAKLTPNCREACSNCGMANLKCGVCVK